MYKGMNSKLFTQKQSHAVLRLPFVWFKCSSSSVKARIVYADTDTDAMSAGQLTK